MFLSFHLDPALPLLVLFSSEGGDGQRQCTVLPSENSVFVESVCLPLFAVLPKQVRAPPQLRDEEGMLQPIKKRRAAYCVISRKVKYNTLKVR